MLRLTHLFAFRGGGLQQRRWFMTKKGLGGFSGKRPLNLVQTSGPKPPPPPPPPPLAAAAAAPAAATTTATTDSSSGGSNTLLPVAAVALLLGGGGAFYYYNNQDSSGAIESPPPSAPVEDDTAKKKEEEEAVKGDSATLNEATVTSSSERGAHRVTQIAMDAKMKNDDRARSMPSTTVSHPEAGHRVAILPPTPPIHSTDATQQAKAILHSHKMDDDAARVLIESHATLRSKLDRTLFADLDNLNPSQLKARIVQLSTELQDRTQWEAIRLKEFLNMKEKETTEKYLELMQKQRHEMEDLMAKKLRDQGRELTSQTFAAVQEKDNSIQTVLRTALEAQKQEHEEDKKAFEEIVTGEIQSSLEEKFKSELEQVQWKMADALQEKVATLRQLTEKLQQLEVALEASQTSKEGSLKAHRLSAAALALSQKLETHDPAKSELAVLKQAAGNEGVIATACATIPESVKTGIPTVPELQAKFETLEKKTRQAVLVPAGRPGLEGQIAGVVLATVKGRPDLNDETIDESSPEVLLAKAKHHVSLGEIETAVEFLERLSGQARFTVQDWIQDALNRVAVEKALTVIKMECALLNESCLDAQQQ